MQKIVCDICGKDVPPRIPSELPSALSQSDFCSTECRLADATEKCAKGDDTCSLPLRQCECSCGRYICATHGHEFQPRCKACGEAEEDRIDKEMTEDAQNIQEETIDALRAYQKALADLEKSEPAVAEIVKAGFPIFVEGENTGPVTPEELIDYSECDDDRPGLIHWLILNEYH